MRRFVPGELVVIREVLRGLVWTIRPVTVLEDSDIQFVSWLAPGTVTDYPIGVEHGETCLAMWESGQWERGPRPWRAPGLLRIAPRGQPFEVFAPLTPENGVLSWYVNFQRPLVRTSLGFDTMDEVLDLVVSRDCDAWERKDVDELEFAVTRGFFTRDDARRITRSCADVEERLARGDVPWDRRWSSWRPGSLPTRDPGGVDGAQRLDAGAPSATPRTGETAKNSSRTQ